MRGSGRYLQPEELERLGMKNRDVEVSWEMSKSKYNGVDPEVCYTALLK